MRFLRIAVTAALAAGIAIAGQGTFAAPASASGSTIQYVNTVTHSTSGRQVFTTVGCPPGTFVVSASADGGGITSLTPLRNSRTSQGLANYTSVAVTGYIRSDTPGGSGTMQVQAGCAPAPQLANGISRSITITPSRGTVRSHGTVYCPAGTRAFGGGGNFLTPNNRYSTTAVEMNENSVTADGTGWTFRGYSTNSTDRLIVTTQCAPLTGSYIIQPSVPAPLEAPGYALARCGIGDTVLSGGMAFTHQDHSDGTGIALSAWTSAGGVGITGTSYDGSQLTARAQCVPRDSF